MKLTRSRPLRSPQSQHLTPITPVAKRKRFKAPIQAKQESEINKTEKVGMMSHKSIRPNTKKDRRDTDLTKLKMLETVQLQWCFANARLNSTFQSQQNKAQVNFL